MTPEGWRKVVEVWGAIWPHRPLPAESVRPWFVLLRDLDDETVQTAIVSWANDPEKSWPPSSPGELREMCSPSPDWEKAITTLGNAIRQHGRYAGRPDLDDPALDAYVDSMGGWTALCDRFDPADSTTRAQFRDTYGTITRRHTRERNAGLLTGILPELGDGRG